MSSCRQHRKKQKQKKLKIAFNPTVLVTAGIGNVERFEYALNLYPHLANVVDPDTNYMPMCLACKNGCVAIVEILFKRGCALTQCCKYSTPLEHAVYGGHASVVETLVRLDARLLDQTQEENTNYIFSSVVDGQLRMVKTLVRLGLCSADSTTSTEGTLLYSAVLRSHKEMVMLLVKLGCTHLNVSDKKGRTLMHVAARRGDHRMIDTLFHLGSTCIDACTHSLSTPMHVAARNNNPSVILELYRLGSNAIDMLDKHFHTPIYKAACTGSWYAAKTLISLRCTIVNVNNSHDTLINAALNEKEYHIVKLFANIGVDYNYNNFSKKTRYHVGIITEKTRHKHRCSIYFNNSLASRLLLQDERLSNQRLSNTMKH